MSIFRDWVVQSSLIMVVLAILTLLYIHKSHLSLGSIGGSLFDNLLFVIIEIGGGGLFTVLVLERNRRRRQEALQAELHVLINACIFRIAFKVSNFVHKFYFVLNADPKNVPGVADLIKNDPIELLKLRTELRDIYNYMQYGKLSKQWRDYPLVLINLIEEFITDAQSESERLFVLLEREMRESEDPETISTISKCDTYNREYCRKSDRNEDAISTLLDFNEFFGHSAQLYGQLENRSVKRPPKSSRYRKEKEPLDFLCDARP